MTTHDFAAGRNREAAAITAVLALPCGLACAGSVVPGLDNFITAVVLALAALVLLGLAARWIGRWMRERREDAADALTATRWRANHAPHLLTADARAHLAIRPAVSDLDMRVVA